jgi:hypothetical protein
VASVSEPLPASSAFASASSARDGPARYGSVASVRAHEHRARSGGQTGRTELERAEVGYVLVVERERRGIGRERAYGASCCSKSACWEG